MSSSDIFFGEVIGTAILLLFGIGSVAAVVLHLPGRGAFLKAGGWIIIAFGWGFGVMAGAYTAAPLSGGHINPAVTLGFAIEGTTEWSDVPFYFAGELTGAFLGAVLAWLVYYGQFQFNRDDDKRIDTVGVFSTGPEVRNAWQNTVTEIIATMSLMLPILAFVGRNRHVEGIGDAGLPILLIAFLVTGIGFSLGAPTGYAINPTRDLGPRIAHQILPIPRKGSSNWSYAWVPIVGPFLGAAIAAGIYNLAY